MPDYSTAAREAARIIAPCPKCGNNRSFSFINGRYGERVICNECGGKGPDRVSRDNAVKAWNKGRRND